MGLPSPTQQELRDVDLDPRLKQLSFWRSDETATASEAMSGGDWRLETALGAARMVKELTPRQGQVLDRMISGYRNKEIAAQLGIDEKTVKMHRIGLIQRLGVSTSASAIRIGVQATFAEPSRSFKLARELRLPRS
jgi:DNA-binding NarL/FixJ family response regulator